MTTKTAATTTKKIPSIGDGATIHVGSDRYGVTVIATGSRSITVQRDSAKQTGDYYGAQRWEHQVNPDGKVEEFTARKDGSWGRKGIARDSVVLTTGQRSTYRDPGF